MKISDLFSPVEKEENIRKNMVDNGKRGAYGSSGSMGNPMYRHICDKGNYVPATMRNYRRCWARSEQKELRRQNERVSKFHNGFA